MKIKDLKDYVYDKVCIYKENINVDGEYIDIYKGFIQEIPAYMLDREIRSIGAKRKGIVDIRIN